MSQIDLTVPIRLEGILTVECIEPGRGVVHRQEVRNLIVDQGLNALKSFKLGDQLLTVCLLGRKGATPLPADGMVPQMMDVWSPQGCANNAGMAFLSNNPPQPRSVVARSTDNGAIPDSYAFVDGAAPYWRLRRTRVFSRNGSHFPATQVIPGTDGPTASDLDWFQDGWLNLGVEASYINEVAFCTSAGIQTFFASLLLCSGPGSLDFDFPLWVGGWLWNRVTLPQSIGFGLAPGEVNIYYPWNGQAPNVVLTHDAVVRVTLELRVYPDEAENIQVVDVEGVPTTCTTRVIDVDSASKWGLGGFLSAFGNWRTDTYAGKIAETNTLPASTRDTFSPPGAEFADDAVKITTPETGEQVMTFRFGGPKGLFPTGVGCLLHGNFTTVALGEAYAFATTFSPKIAKTDEQRLDINVRYVWSRR